MRVGRKAVGNAVLFLGLSLSPEIVHAREQSHRLARISFQLDVPHPADDEAQPLMGMLSATDRANLAARRLHSARLAIGDVDIAFVAGRTGTAPFSSTGPGYGLNRSMPMDRWSVKNFGVMAGLPLTDTLSISGHGSYLMMVRKLAVVPTDPARHRRTIMEAGLSIGIEEWQTISLDYIDSALSSRQRGWSRMAETLGGAPLAGHGYQLGFASTNRSGPRKANWQMQFSAMRRPDLDLWSGGQLANRLDKRAMLSAALNF